MPVRRTFALSLVLVPLALLALPRPAPSSSLCGDALKQLQTFRQEAGKPFARMILYGTISNPRLVGGNGITDLNIKVALRSDPILKGKTSIQLPQYLYVNDKKDPPKWLVFCDVAGGKI